jgi:hypothetical protein
LSAPSSYPVRKRLRYFLERDALLQGAALRLFLRAVEQCLTGGFLSFFGMSTTTELSASVGNDLSRFFVALNL